MEAAAYSEMEFTQQKMMVQLSDGSFVDLLDASDSDVAGSNGAIVVTKDFYMPKFALIMKDNLDAIKKAENIRVAKRSQGFRDLDAAHDPSLYSGPEQIDARSKNR